MRLRKNLKRTAAAALALSMAVSTAAVPASATTYFKVDQNSDLTITKDTSGISDAGTGYTKTEVDDGKTDIVLTSDDAKMPSDGTTTTQSMDDAPDAENKAATLEASEKDTAPVADETEPTEDEDTDNTDNTEETGGTEEKTEDAPADGIATMDLPGEDEPEGTADEGQPERTVTETEQGTVIEYGDYTVDPDVQVSKPAPKAEKKDDEKEYTSSTTNSITAKFADTVTGTVSNVIKIINKVAGTNLNVTLDNVNIDASQTGDLDTNLDGKAALSVEGAGDVTIKLKGENTLKSGYGHAGLEKNVDVTIDSEGKTTLSGDNTGNLTITSDEKAEGGYDGYEGKLTATGGYYGAGIGGGGSKTDKGQSTGNITIAGGSIKATGGNSGAGIGGGGSSSGNAGNGAVTITGGSITATGSYYYGAGIGSGGSSSGNGGSGNVTITSGTVTAIGGTDGAGIGGGGTYYGNAGDGTVLISGGNITATGKQYGAGIGGGGSRNSNGGNGGKGDVTITSGTVTAECIGRDSESIFAGAGIGGGGSSGANSTAGEGKVTISGGTISASACKNTANKGYGAGIGGGGHTNGGSKGSPVAGKGTVTITGGTITTAKGNYGAGIGGGGAYGKGTAGEGDVIISGGTITEAASNYGAGIGGGGVYGNYNFSTGDGTAGKGDVTIEKGAAVKKTSSGYGAGIGGGGANLGKGAAGIVKIKDSTVETAQSTNANGGAGIGNGGGAATVSERGSVTLENATIGKFEKDENGNLKKDDNGDPILESGTGAISKGADAIGNGKNTPIGADVAKDSSSAVASKGSEDATTTIAPPSHTHTAGSWETASPATCITEGREELRCTSDECGHALLSYKTTPVDPEAHSWGDWNPMSGDSTQESRTCTVCGATESRTAAPTENAPLPSDDSNSSASVGKDKDEGGVMLLDTGLSVLDTANTDIIGDAQLVTLSQVSNVLYIDAEKATASLEGVLLDLAELKADDIDTVVFSTKERTSTLYTAELVALGTGDTHFILIHSGSSATLTVGGVQHNELIH